MASECGVNRKLAESYFGILDDLQIARRLPPFTKRSKRRIAQHAKFYFFDVGVYRTLRPAGPLDVPEEAEGPAAETLLLQNLLAVNDALGLGYKVHYWRTSNGTEVDFVLYGERGLLAFEVKRGRRVTAESLTGLKAFSRDYPVAKLYLASGAPRRLFLEDVEVWPIQDLLADLPSVLSDRGK